MSENLEYDARVSNRYIYSAPCQARPKPQPALRTVHQPVEDSTKEAPKEVFNVKNKKPVVNLSSAELAAREAAKKIRDARKLTPEGLEALRQEEERLIAKWGIQKLTSEETGNFLTAHTHIRAGEVVMIFPPYKIMSWDEVEQSETVAWNNVICVQEGGAVTGMFSASLDQDTLDNFMNHSCNPNLRVSVREDYTCVLESVRDIPPHTSLTFNYNHTEEDLILQGVDFHCLCGEAECVGHVKGKVYVHREKKETAAKGN